MENFDQTVMEFNSLIKSYSFLEALNKFYHPDVISADNTNPSILGLSNLIKETEHFIENAQIESIVLRSITIEKNLTVSNWHYKFTHKTFGLIDTNQISVQRWQNGKICQEHHFYIS